MKSLFKKLKRAFTDKVVLIALCLLLIAGIADLFFNVHFQGLLLFYLIVFIGVILMYETRLEVPKKS